MRWNAYHLTALATTLALVGCTQNKTNKGAVALTTDDGLYYVDSASEQPAPAYEPADTYLVDSFADSSYVSEVPESPVAAAPRYHVVVKQDTLYSLARKYYGDHKRWKDIYKANSSQISNPNMIRVGQQLRIP